MAEMMGPYDPASPCLTTFCKRISTEDFEKQGSEYTQNALAELIEYLEYNPTAYHNILRKRKREDAENGGIFSWLKAKMLSTIKGDEYLERLDRNEAKGKLCTLKDDIISSYNYSEEAKGSGKRFSTRIANRNKLAASNHGSQMSKQVGGQESINIVKNLQVELDSASPSVSRSATPRCSKTTPNEKETTFIPKPPPPPPVLPPPPPPPICRNIHSNENIQSKKHPLLSINLGKNDGPTTRSQVIPNANTRAHSDSAADELMALLKNPNIRASLKSVGDSDHSPYSRRQKMIDANTDKENEFPLFNQQLISKFQNARSPTSPAESQYLSDVSSPDSFAASP